jgi:predicted transposase YbfD/YdcC
MNEQAVETSIEACFGRLYDGRVQGRCEHKLIDIIIIAVCGMITGAESWVEVETFGKEREAWLATVLELPNGIPSHDTIGRVFAALDAEAFQECFTRWVETVYRVTKGQVVAIDGKTARRSHDKTIGKDAIHMVSAWASANGIVLGQRKVDDKSNEITAIPELLRVLDVAGCIVTIDAMGCQKKIAQTIRDEKADYVLSVKDNQAKLHQDIQDWFAYGDQVNFENMESSYYETIDKGHGRIEIRRCWVVSDQLAFEHIRHHDGWAGLQSIVRVQRERRQAENIQLETAFYISSLANDAAAILEATRSHWGIENRLHWVLDVTFREDESRVRRGNSPQNMTVLRHLALNILKKDKTKGSLRTKRYKAALNTTFLEQLLDQV